MVTCVLTGRKVVVVVRRVLRRVWRDVVAVDVLELTVGYIID